MRFQKLVYPFGGRLIGMKHAMDSQSIDKGVKLLSLVYFRISKHFGLKNKPRIFDDTQRGFRDKTLLFP